MNNRPFLAVYTPMLSLNLDGKSTKPGHRASVQRAASPSRTSSDAAGTLGSSTCYARSALPGCKAVFLAFESKTLMRWYAVAFGLVPVHIAIIAIALLCANHVTYRFGKGMMPKAYRLSREAMAVVVQGYAAQLAEQYGPDAAAHMLSASNLGSGANSARLSRQLERGARDDAVCGAGDGRGTHVKYDSVGAGGVRDTSI
ncbi:hypothetical protein B0H14DRAFT_3140653 [Mycena olivaceomarginata]|nr:hypothetical protein B0H14DRAFT_3140653 [Mycena olivaceomarginata]